MSPSPADPARTARGTTVAYVVNRYPAPSHSFIRREILALEGLGVRVRRFSVRPGDTATGAAIDREEGDRTTVLLAGGALGLAFALLHALLTRPFRWFAALRLALRLGRRSDRGLLVHLVYLAEAAVLLRCLRAPGSPAVDVLHAHFGTNSTTVAMLCTALGGPPFGFTAHGPEEFERAEGIGLAAKVERAAHVVAISDFGRSQVWRFTVQEQWDKVAVVRCGVDAAFLGAPPAAPVDEPALLWVGRLAPEKGIPVLVEACRLLHERGVAFGLTIVGGGPLEAWLRARLHELGLADRVVLAGWQTGEQIAARMDRARGLVVASFAEGLPVVVMEAMARGRPVVATRIAAMPELVDETTGWLVPPGRADRLADAMHELLAQDRATRQRLGAAARERVARLHDAAAEAAKLAGLFAAAARQEQDR